MYQDAHNVHRIPGALQEYNMRIASNVHVQKCSHYALYTEHAVCLSLFLQTLFHLIKRKPLKLLFKQHALGKIGNIVKRWHNTWTYICCKKIRNSVSGSSYRPLSQSRESGSDSTLLVLFYLIYYIIYHTTIKFKLLTYIEIFKISWLICGLLTYRH